ncbi:MAG: hypothetical protein ACQESG_01650 [Nanobdellota archaeon]
MKQKRNRLLWDKHTVLFDFDQMFYGPQHLLKDYNLKDEILFETNLQEHRTIVERVESNEDEFFGLVKLIGNLTDRSHRKRTNKTVLWVNQGVF